MSLIKAMKTIYFFESRRKKINTLTYEEVKNFILETWGNEIIDLIKKGKFEVEDFLDYIAMPDDEKKKWAMKLEQFVTEVKK